MTRTEILRLAKNRMIMGNRKHGHFDPKTDTRNHYDEMIDELLDVINYSMMEILKINELKKRREKL